ncbi:MAG: hypothetical protein EPO32_11480 [Anaerolineae bacterium]|nr:MAG: hypothetical protein EPO32_11480 [Anaerolineae bacterium]
MTLNHYPRSWYPLCKSEELRLKGLVEVPAFGTRLAVFRTLSGKVGALRAECAHMGANLADGRVCGERLQCPLHEWEYGVEGRCEFIPAENNIPARASQPYLKCIERFGLVLGFLGGEPEFEFPEFEESDNSCYSQAYTMEFDTPYQVLAANSFDSQHFATVHHRRLVRKPDLNCLSPHHFSVRFEAIVEGRQGHDRILRAAGVKTVALEAHCWGGNSIFAYNTHTKARILFIILPISETRCRVYVLNVLHSEAAPKSALLRRLMLAVIHWLTISFLKPDIRVLRGLQFKLGTLLPDSDHAFIEWVKYWKGLALATLESE